MNYKLIAIDFDGTLLNDDKKIMIKTKDTLIKYRKLGYIVARVTGRPLEAAKNLVPFNIFDYLILNNGSNFYDVHRKQAKYIDFISKDQAYDLVKEVKPIARKIEFCTINYYYTYQMQENDICSYIKTIDNIEDIVEEISKINIFFSDQSVLEYYRDKLCNMDSKIDCLIIADSTCDERWLVIQPKGLNKKTTLQELGKKLSIELQEMVFFGDGLNDLELMNSSVYGVAMGNALEKIKQVAKEVTLSNNDDGVAVFLDHFLKE